MAVHVKSFRMNTSFVHQAEQLPGVVAETKKKAEQLQSWAITVFDAAVKHTHPVTPPPYRGSFFVARRGGKGWVLYNDDPAAVFVEFGSHPGGGQTTTLGYRPLGKAIDIAAGRA